MNEAGATAVEFAFVMPILLLMFSGIVRFGSVLFPENHMTSVARDATRKIAIGDLAQADAESAVQQSLVNWGVTYDVQALITDAGGGNQDITVTISLPMHEAALIDVEAAAVASSQGGGDACVIALDPSVDDALKISGNA